ncbi:MAG: Rieske 2Fe-2S domain-containing protein [Myxococcales bacterium]|nr:Rieske 2Fe-2S domain-containing protein [Myxococcales bacterium]MCB9704964.1 Rieske 2Fe-2S domain-containing protein [Myxococcales bacterium]
MKTITRPTEAVREATYPPPYPDGWYRVSAADQLAPGELRYLECLGKQFVLYRSEDGKSVHAMSAFCPHLGANLQGGCVKGQQVECPFHRWRLAADGRVAHIPYSDRVPHRVRQETWPIRERYGQIFIYHRGGGHVSSADEAPPYEIPAIPEVDAGTMVYRGRHDAGTVRMHLIEFAENSVDFAHFAPIHSEMMIPWTRFKVPFVGVRHDAAWEPDPEHPHLAYFHNKAMVEILGRPIERSRANATITFIGPGSVVTFRFSIPDVGEIVMFQTHLPVAPLEQKVDFHWFADRKIPRLLVSYVVGNWVSQWANDIEIWESKIYMNKPALAKGDGPVHRMRKWFRGFYPEAPEEEPAAAAP